MAQQCARGCENALAELRGLADGLAASAQLEVRRLQFQHDCRSGEPRSLGAAGNLLRHLPQNSKKLIPVADIFEEGCLRSDAFGSIAG